jgi:hypothetical protein
VAKPLSIPLEIFDLMLPKKPLLMGPPSVWYVPMPAVQLTVNFVPHQKRAGKLLTLIIVVLCRFLSVKLVVQFDYVGV